MIVCSLNATYLQDPLINYYSYFRGLGYVLIILSPMCTVLLVESLMSCRIPHPLRNIAYNHNLLKSQGVSTQKS